MRGGRSGSGMARLPRLCDSGRRIETDHANGSSGSNERPIALRSLSSRRQSPNQTDLLSFDPQRRNAFLPPTRSPGPSGAALHGPPASRVRDLWQGSSASSPSQASSLRLSWWLCGGHPARSTPRHEGRRPRPRASRMLRAPSRPMVMALRCRPMRPLCHVRVRGSTRTDRAGISFPIHPRGSLKNEVRKPTSRVRRTAWSCHSGRRRTDPWRAHRTGSSAT